MPFWAYLLHCRDRTFYAGHTDDLDVRIAQHQSGAFRGYTFRKRPVTLVWSAEFSTRDEAIAAELQVKGWRREKKLALIRGDWGLIQELARGGKGRPSPGSGQAGAGARPLPASAWLHPHLAHLPSQPFSLEAKVRRNGACLRVRYRLAGPIELLLIPKRAESLSRDGLWKHTCFEAFVKSGSDPAYLEFNLSPSTEWAAYRFSSYREGMAALAMPAPESRVARGRHALELTAVLALPPGLDDLSLNLSAVIEEKSGAKSYWALAHPPSGPPDFHHPDCFTLELPPPGEP